MSHTFKVNIAPNRYSEGDPRDQTVAFEVEDEAGLQDAASTLESLGHAVHSGTAQEAEQRKVKGFIGFRDPSSSLSCARSAAGDGISQAAMPASLASATTA
jgi:hypothetical protein